jgi:hypothetical protein
MDDGRKRAINPKEVAPPLKGHYSNSVRVTAGPMPRAVSWAQATCAPRQRKSWKTSARSYAPTAEMEDVVSVTVYVTDISAFHNIADIRLQYFPKDGPASATVEVSNLALPELMIEIAAVAAVP